MNKGKRKKRFRKTLPSLERPVHVVAERVLKPKLRMEEEDYNNDNNKKTKKKNKQKSLIFVDEGSNNWNKTEGN